MEWLSPAIASAVLIGFWAWTRSNILKLSAAVSTLQAQNKAIEQRCSERREDMQSIFGRIDETRDMVATRGETTAQALGHLAGQVESLIARSQ